MAKATRDVSLYCTPERMKHARELVIEPRETGSAGNVILTGQRELQTCALDVLHRKGLLALPTDQKDEARWRFNSGYWLRELYLKTHPTDGIGAYSLRLEGQKGVIQKPISAEEINDAEDWNFQCFVDTARDVKRHWRILEQVCLEDTVLASSGPICIALDALFALREGYIPDFLASFEKALEPEG